ncbi:MAG: multicopper oxidase domain-containing protein, partial [Armatimonadota bacterium]
MKEQKITRRNLLKAGAAVGAAGAAATSSHAMAGITKLAKADKNRAAAKSASPAKPVAALPLDNAAALALPKFVWPVQQPAILTPGTAADGSQYYEIAAMPTTHQVYPGWTPTPMWAYGQNGTTPSFPGPTMVAEVNKPVTIKWLNQIPDGTPHLLASVIDTNFAGADNGEPDARMTVHLHGAHVRPEYDGDPEAWFTYTGTTGIPTKTGSTYVTNECKYPNLNNAGTYWYHDHTLGITRLNVYAGMAGYYILTDPAEASLNLPSGPYDLGLCIQDRMFNDDGTLFYPTNDLQGTVDSISGAVEHPGPWIPEFYGNMMMVNGRLWPYLEVEPRRYRFRILNGCNARVLSMALWENTVDQTSNIGGTPGPQITVVGSDQGLLPAAAPLGTPGVDGTTGIQTGVLTQSSGERYDIVIDFAGLAGKTFVLANDANSPYPGGDPIVPGIDDLIMQFKVTLPLTGTDTSLDVNVVPSPSLKPITALAPASAAAERNLTIVEFMDSSALAPITGLFNNRKYHVNGSTTSTTVDYGIDPSLKPVVGSTEIWNFVNLTGDAHPIHMHLVEMQLLDRTPFDPVLYEAALAPTGMPGPGMGPDPIKPTAAHGLLTPAQPFPWERGWKDTLIAYPGEVTRVITKFGDFSGPYPIHCHILEHEDNEMMVRYEVQAGVQSVTLSAASVTGTGSVTATVTLTGRAPNGGVTVSLASSNPTIAALSAATVTIPAGQKTGTVTIATTAVAAAGTATITGTLNGYASSTTLTVTPPVVTSLALSLASVTGGVASTLTVTLNAVAPVGGTTVALASNNAAATVPVSVVIAAGATTGTATVTTVPVIANTTCTLTATAGASSATQSLQVLAPLVSTVSVVPAAITGGHSVVGQVTLTGLVAAAQTAGQTLTITSDNPIAVPPATVVVRAGRNTATFTIRTTAVTVAGTANIKVTSGAVSGSAPLTVNPPGVKVVQVSGLSLSLTSVVGGAVSVATVGLTAPAPVGGFVVTVTAGVGATVPPTVLVPAGATSAAFNITTAAVVATTNVVITASGGGRSRTATLAVTPQKVTALAVTPVSVVGGGTITGTVTIGGPAAAGGFVVSLAASKPAVTVPASVTVLAGATTATFVATSVPVAATTALTISASGGGVAINANVSVTAPAIAAVALTPLTVKGGTTSTLTVTLNGAAPAGGTVVTLAASSTRATVPASVTVPAGQLSATQVVTTAATTRNRTVVITARTG